MPASMQAVLVKDGKSESADGLHIGQTDRPSPKDGQVLVRVRAFGLNRMDIMQRQGLYPLPPGAPEILGVEFSGEVVDGGKSSWKEGDEVFGLAYGGAYAEYIAVEAGMLTTKPKEMSHVQAAAIPESMPPVSASLTYKTG